MAMFADNSDAFAFIRMAQMGQDDANLGKANCDIVQKTRQGAFERGLVDERSSRMQERGKLMVCGIAPQVIELRRVRSEARIHRQQLDPSQPEILMTLFELISPARLGGIHGKE